MLENVAAPELAPSGTTSNRSWPVAPVGEPVKIAHAGGLAAKSKIAQMATVRTDADKRAAVQRKAVDIRDPPVQEINRAVGCSSAPSVSSALPQNGSIAKRCGLANKNLICHILPANRDRAGAEVTVAQLAENCYFRK